MINILVTLDSNYMNPLKVMLKSLFINNPQEDFTIYLLHSTIDQNEIEELDTYIKNHNQDLEVIYIGEEHFKDAPTLLYYTKAMYYRLLAYKFLPQDMDRILYLDPDTLVINSVRELYEMDIEDYLYAAAGHDIIPIKEINKIRLYPYGIKAYYNSGILLMNLEMQRQYIDEEYLYNFIKKNKQKLIMPDQDIINALYCNQIKTIDEKRYNYDARYFNYYRIMSNGLWNMDYVMNHTVIIHFCGKKKPWNKGYSGKFYSLYKHYEKLAANKLSPIQ